MNKNVKVGLTISLIYFSIFSLFTGIIYKMEQYDKTHPTYKPGTCFSGFPDTNYGITDFKDGHYSVIQSAGFMTVKRRYKKFVFDGIIESKGLIPTKCKAEK